MIIEAKSERSRYRWLVLAVCLFAFVAYAFSFQLAPPLMTSIKNAFNVTSDAQTALVMSVVLVPGIFLSIPAGSWVGTYGVKRVGTLSLVAVVVGDLVTAFAYSDVVLLVGRLLVGIGGTFVMTVTPAIIAQWFTKKDLGKAMGIFGVNMPLAAVIAFPTAGSLLLVFDWRFPFYVGLILGIAATIAYLAVVKEGPNADHGARGSVREAFGNVEILKIGIMWLFFNAAALSFTTWGDALFESFRSIPKLDAVFLASLLMWCAVFFVPVYGCLSDRVHRRKPFIVLGFVLMTMAFVLVGFTSDMALVASILFAGVAAAMIPAVQSALTAEVMRPSLLTIGFGITGTCLNIGAALAQPVIGFVRDATQSYTPCLLAIAALSAVGAMVAMTLKPSQA
jgi:MFS family permease